MNEFKKVGFTEEQAMVQAKMLAAISEEQLLTKQDLKQTELKLTLEIQEVRREIQEVKRARNEDDA